MTAVLGLLILGSCTDNEEISIAIPPADGELLINPSNTNVVLIKEQANNTAISFSWDTSDYGISTPTNFALEIDSADGDFSSPETIETGTTELEITHARLNAISSSLELPTEEESQIQVRLKTSLRYGALPTYSKVESISVTPYEDLVYPLPDSGELYLQGDAVPTNWGYPLPESQKLTKINNFTFSIITELTGGKNYAFLSITTGWGSPAYVAQDGNQSPSSGNFIPNSPNTTPPWQGTALTAPAATGVYEVTINFKTGKYSVTPQ